MDYSVVIPTNRSFDTISILLDSLVHQTLPPHEIVIVYDKHDTQVDEYCRQVRHFLSSYQPILVKIVYQGDGSDFVVGKGASYVRNYGRSLVASPYMMFVDDDNRLDSDALQGLLSYRALHTDQSTILVPVQLDGWKLHVRAAFARGFNYLLCRPEWITTIDWNKHYIPLSLVSSNCLFGPTAVFEQYPFDESIPFVYEDLIRSGMANKAGISLLCDTTVSIHHYHMHTSRLSALYIDTPIRAYYKSKHRILLVKHIGTLPQRIVFFSFGLRGHTIWLRIHIIRFAPVSERYGLTKSLIKGIYDGIRMSS